MKGGEIRNSFLMIVSYCCEVRGASITSTDLKDAVRKQPCVICHSIYEDRVRGRKS